MLRGIAALLMLAAWPATEVVAQDQRAPAANFSGVYGIVVDSINGGPLPNAIVRVDSTKLQAITDGKGHYRIDSLPPGVYRLSLHHPILDTLGMAIGTGPIEFPAGRFAIVPLGVPSAQAMLDIACPKVANPEGPAGLLGVVQDPDTRKPAIGAVVSLSWTEVRVSREFGVRRIRRVRTAVVDSAGNYAICGLPTDMSGTAQATLNGAATASVDISIDEMSLIGLRSLGLGAMEPVIDTIDGAARTRWRGKATLRGRVVGPDGAAVAGAQVEVPGTPAAALSSATGGFILSNLPVGTQAVVARGVGFSPSTAIVELSAKTPRDITVALTSVQVLAPIEAQVAAAGLDRVGFTERQRSGMGRFITHEQIEQRRPMAVTDVFTGVPGIQMGMDASGNQVLRSTRSVPGSADSCVAVFVDRFLLRAPMPERLVDHLNFVVRPEQLWAMEIYQPNQVPGEFITTGQRCLTIVVWTRMAVGEMRNQPTP